MSFTTLASASWFNVTPATGTIAPNGATTVYISGIYAGTLPISNANNISNNKGSVNVSAPGYADNNQLTVTLSCGITSSGVQDSSDPTAYTSEACHVSVVCPPCSTNTGGNTTYAIASVMRTSGSSLYQLSANPNLPPQTQVMITGIEDNSFNGTYFIASVPQANQFVVTQSTLPDATSGPGTAYVPEVVSCPW
jgi:hypothetical protein